MRLKNKSEYHEQNSLTEKIECLEENISIAELDLLELNSIKLNRYPISELIIQARIKLRSFLVSKQIFEVIPDNSKIIAVSSNIPLVIAICFLLEDKKKSIMVYDESEDNLVGSFTCNDVMIVFFIIYLLVNEEKSELPFSSIEELSVCSIKHWMNTILNLEGYNSNLILDINGTLLDGANICLDLVKSKKTLKIQDTEFLWREFGCWVTQKENSKGLHPICYFSCLTILSSLVQSLQICEHNDNNFQKFLDVELKDGKYEFECNTTAEESIINRFFHKKVRSQLNIISDQNKKYLKMSSSLLSAIELFLIEGQTHIPIVSDDDEIFIGQVLTLEKCCIFFARSIANQEKVNLMDSLELLFCNKSIELNNNSSLINKVTQNIKGNSIFLHNSNCKEECFEHKIQSEFDEETSWENIVDICLSGAISHILLSEEQCIVLIDKESSKVAALLTAQDICKFLLDA